MKAIEKLKNKIINNKTFLCVGLDTDINKMPTHMKGDINNIIDFNREIINATKDFVCSYKINFAFYEQYGFEGYKLLEETFKLIPDDIFTIADAKRGDIGNTSKAYAKACFEGLSADSITVSPYMGHDSIKPFLEFEDKMVFILGLTSNPGSNDFQQLVSSEKKIYQHVLEISSKWDSSDKIGYVIGATHPEEFTEVRKLIPDNPLLIPGVGSQGGDLEAVLTNAGKKINIVNVSRAVIYASDDKDFAQSSAKVAEYYQRIMSNYV